MGYLIGYIISGVVIIISVIIALVAQSKVNDAFQTYKDINSTIDLTGCELAEKLCSDNNLNLTIKSCKGNLTDHYNPKDKSINISQSNFNSKSIAAQSIVAHEFGHALQDKENYSLFKLRQFVIKTSNFASRLLLPLLIIGIILELVLLNGIGSIVIYVSIGIYGLSLIANLVTLPVEINASKRAKDLMFQLGATSEDEVYATDRMLNAAAMTYVAGMLVSLAYFLRYLFLLLAFTRKD